MTLTKDFDRKSTMELISLFQDKRGSNQSTVHASFSILCLRFRERVLNKCEIICSQYGHNTVVAEIIAERVFKKYAAKPGFSLNKASNENVDTAFELYLLGITKRELINYYREIKSNHLYDGTEKVITEIPFQDVSKMASEKRMLYEAVQSLNPRLKTVFLTYEAYRGKGVNLPKKLQAELREHLGGVKQTTVRGYYWEARKIIEIHRKVIDGINPKQR